MKTKLNFLAIGGTLFLLALIVVNPVLAQTGATYFVSDVDASAFPVVTFKLRAVDFENRVVSSLDAPNAISVYENGEQSGEVNVTPKSDGPINYIFVIDQGYGSNYIQFQVTNLRQIFSTLVSGGFFIDDLDTVIVLGRQNISGDRTTTLLPATQTGSDLTTWAANFNFERSTRNTKGLLAIEDAIQQMEAINPVQGSETDVIIFLTRYIEDPSATVAPTSAQNTAELAREAQISIYVLQTDVNQYRKDALEILADGSNGQYVGLNRSNFLGQTTSVYQFLDTQRTYYQVSYRSPIAEATRREITINAPIRQDEGESGSYEISLQEPTVDITKPIANSTIRREAVEEPEAATPVFDTSRTAVLANISWPDGYPRKIASAELYVNGNLEQSLQVESDQSSLEFDWDLSDITTAGDNNTALEVRVTDELGFTASKQTSVNVEVNEPERKTGLGGISPLIASLGAAGLCIVGLGALAILGIAFYFIRKSAASRAEGEAEVVESKPTLVGDEVEGVSLAMVTLVEGPSGLKDEVFKITTLTTKIGRDPSWSDLIFYADEDSSVSRRHCVIKLDSDNVFRLIDQGSSAGTRLNGREIQPEVPVDLDDGDEIVLGNLAQRGIKLIFNYMSEDSEIPLSGTADDRTHVLSDEDLKHWDDLMNEASDQED
ncbi:MAG: FHA domain-containing protein [Anaerolineales bacterium]|jgi:hypothetical protein